MSDQPNVNDISQARARTAQQAAAVTRDLAGDVRKARAQRLLVRLAVWVVLPTVCASIYYGLWATPQYESVSVLAVHSNKSNLNFGLLAGIIPASGSAQDAMVVSEYIRSRDMLGLLAKDQGFVTHYQSRDADFVTRLASDASSEDIFEYYLDKVQLSHSSESGALTLRVRAYSAERAREFSRRITTFAEKKVNLMSEREQNDRLALTQREVKKAEDRLANARLALLRLQREGGDLSPIQSATAVLALRGELEGKLVQAKVELEAALAIMQRDAPEVVALRQRTSSLRRQIAKQNQRLANSDEGGGINASIARFEPAVIEKEIAQQTLETALKALEIARVEAAGQQRYLVTIAEPSLPDQATHPKRLWGIVTVLVLSLALMVIFSLVIATVREHAKL